MAQPEKRESSVLFSLRELRQIEESRVQEEEHAVRTAEEARVAAVQEAERRRREAEEAKARAEREELLRIETARENADREARTRVESAEAMERQRAQAALEQQRLQHEMELRRAEVAKKRPTWMLAVTGFALVAAIGLIFFAVQRKRESDAASVAAQKSEDERKRYEVLVKEARDQVEQVVRDSKELEGRLSAADTAVKAAQTDADRRAANANLEKLRQQKLEMEQRIAAAKAAADKAERAKGVHLSKECLENPLAKGCSGP
jgi:colicin import membrane protein